jgi:hypothetical protein
MWFRREFQSVLPTITQLGFEEYLLRNFGAFRTKWFSASKILEIETKHDKSSISIRHRKDRVSRVGECNTACRDSNTNIPNPSNQRDLYPQNL